MSEVPAIDDVPDYGTDADPIQGAIDDAFTKLEQLTIDEERAALEVKRAEAALANATAAYKQIVERDIPDLMTRMRQDRLKLSNGVEITLKREIRAALPSAKEKLSERLQALQWLVDNGHASLIKNKVAVELDRGQDERANALVKQLKADGFEAAASKDVHAGTLSALVRELYTAGKTVPTKLLGVFDQKIAQLKRK